MMILSADNVKIISSLRMSQVNTTMENMEGLNEKLARNESYEEISSKKDSDPGAARLGNFINYYQFNPPSERLSHLFPNKLVNELEHCVNNEILVCLDVGCNSGVSTKIKYL